VALGSAPPRVHLLPPAEPPLTPLPDVRLVLQPVLVLVLPAQKVPLGVQLAQPLLLMPGLGLLALALAPALPCTTGTQSRRRRRRRRRRHPPRAPAPPGDHRPICQC